MSKPIPRAEPLRQRLEHSCDCGGELRADMEHYQRVSCRQCGLIWWALQPKRDDGLKLFKWPAIVPAAQT